MSTISLYLSMEEVSANGVGNPNISSFPYSLSRLGTQELQQNSNSSGNRTLIKNEDGNYTADIPVGAGRIGVYSTESTSL